MMGKELSRPIASDMPLPAPSPQVVCSTGISGASNNGPAPDFTSLLKAVFVPPVRKLTAGFLRQ